MNSNFVIMGLPGSGKTTFLAALWHIVEAGEKPCRLKLDKLVGDLTYLNKISQAWRTYQPVARTSQTGDTDVIMHLVDSVTGSKGRAFFPDVAGERFSSQIEARRSHRAFVENVRNSDGILLFINANSKQDYLSIIELNSMLPPNLDLESLDQDDTRDADVTLSDVEAEGELLREWEPKFTPSQVQIVQMLSDLLRAPYDVRPRRLAVIVSAWDIAIPRRMTPDGWIAANMPLLDQFLRTNRDFFTSRVYGVSAQGIDLQDQSAVRRVSKGNPSERILIVTGSEAGHDITAPLVWLMTDG